MGGKSKSIDFKSYALALDLLLSASANASERPKGYVHPHLREKAYDGHMSETSRRLPDADSEILRGSKEM